MPHIYKPCSGGKPTRALCGEEIAGTSRFRTAPMQAGRQCRKEKIGARRILRTRRGDYA